MLYLINMLPRCLYGSVISELSVLGSHKPNLGILGSDNRELTLQQFGRCNIFVTLAFLDVSSMKRCL